MKIKLGRNNIANQSSYGKWYGRVKYESTLSEDELAKCMIAHGSAFSRGCILGVIHDLATEIRNQILQGHPVKISNLAIFKVGIETDGLSQPEQFDPETSIKRVFLVAQATGDTKPSRLREELQPHVSQKKLSD